MVNPHISQETIISEIRINVVLSDPVKSSVLAEIYGIEKIGTIRSLFTMIMVSSTALGPLFIGSLMDIGLPVEHISLVLAVLVFGAIINNQRIRSHKNT